MDWEHWFRFLLAAFGSYFLFTFSQLQHDTRDMRDHLADVKRDLATLGESIRSHERRIGKLEDASASGADHAR